MPTNSGPIQQGRSVVLTTDGHIVDRHLVYLSDFSAGNMKDAMSSMPPLGSPDPEQFGAPLYSQQIVNLIDGKQAYGQLTYDNRGGGGYFIGKLARGSRTSKAIVQAFDIPQIAIVSYTAGGIASRSLILDPIVTRRAHRYRVETRTIRTGNIQALIDECDSQIGKTWEPGGTPYIFSDWTYSTSGGTSDFNTYRIEYEFYASGPVEAVPAQGLLLAVPELGANQEYGFTRNAVSISAITAVNRFSRDAGDQVVLQQL